MFQNLNLLAADWNLGINVTITGLTIVFGMLILLVFILSIFGLFFSKNTVKEKKKVAPKKEDKPKKDKVEVHPKVSVSTNNNDEIIAVIAAAVATLYDGSNVQPVIKRIKKSSTKSRPAWTAAGIFENTRSF